MRCFQLSIKINRNALMMVIVSLALAGLSFGIAKPVSALQDGPDDPILTYVDEGCLGCHGKPDLTRELSSGEVWSLTINQDHFLDTVHADEGVTCTSCHSDIEFYPHVDFPARSLREVSILLYPLCQNCHVDEYNNTLDSIHQVELAGGNFLAAVCVDCHDPHTQGRITDPISGKLLPETRIHIPQVCAKCHNGIYETYSRSVHGNALSDESNQDVPTCISCHGVHNINDPRTDEFRTNSPLLCSGCHTDANIMDKYGISTNVLNTYVADFHGTTITLFEKTDPDQPSNKPVCYDCHGIHDIKRSDDPQYGISTKENLLIKCQVCHPDATPNFPDAWMSHYDPSPTEYPLVYYINLFYKFFIPVVLGGMGLYVLLDLIHRIVVRIKGVAHK